MLSLIISNGRFSERIDFPAIFPLKVYNSLIVNHPPWELDEEILLMKRWRLALFIIVFLLLIGSAYAEQPRREDIGDLIVLHLYGTYHEMGKQQAELLGPDLRRVYEMQLEDFTQLASGAGFGGRFFNYIMIPLYSAVAPFGDDSHFQDEIGGIASVLRVPRRNVMRALFSLAGGSTVFAATRSATADGQSLIGRNVDWGDAYGLRRPVVAIYHPTEGDLDYIFTGWPLVGLPTVGLNEAGLAVSLNFFVSEPRVSLFFPAWPHRSVLQKAKTVEEAIQLIAASGRRGLSAFYVMADATGDIAMVEWTPTRFAVYRPDEDWFGQANHARTQKMIPYDRYRHPDSFQRRAAMEAAVRRHLGNLTPELAVEILRDRTGAAFANEPSVGNPNVINPVVVHPSSLTLWHSTVMQPHAPYGSYVPFTFFKKSVPPTFPASELLTTGALDQERKEIQTARSALKLHREEKFQEARKTWIHLLDSNPGALNTRRLALGYASTLASLNDTKGAYAALETAADKQAPFDVRGLALVARGILADRLGLRGEAIRHYHAALEHFQSQPDFTAFASEMKTARRGLEKSQAKIPLPISPYDVGVPQ
ncbi:MAG: hypothetical protein C4520_04540 [Candidatus Abyssobacteria bacterium SURF_5]|uniref:Peptidase C45 hydrolase domain-containing protein n=1 Tax=Abyssobacteria bacterium (strain SURF_5) TaxID=2093360 RepID=A0A3A4NYX2_ABYX5|nr:MAG: hypothetical protein C4520_04540 [Candidatus Abyssubacteria bacterium SURF_5]